MDENKLDDRVSVLFESGHGRNAIARRLHVTTHEVDAAARRLGIQFDRSQTAAAVRSRQIVAAEERQDIADGLRRLARLQLETAFNGMLTPSQLKDCAVVLGIAVQREIDIAKHLDAVDAASNIDQQHAADAFNLMLKNIHLAGELDQEQRDSEQ